MSKPKTYSVSETARETGFTLTHLYQLLRSGRLPGASRIDGLWVIPIASVRLLQKARRERAGGRP